MTLTGAVFVFDGVNGQSMETQVCDADGKNRLITTCPTAPMECGIGGPLSMQYGDSVSDVETA